MVDRWQIEGEELVDFGWYYFVFVFASDETFQILGAFLLEHLLNLRNH